MICEDASLELIVARALTLQHRLALGALAGVKRRGVDIDDEFGAGLDALADRARLPDVLAHAQADAPTAKLDHARPGSGLEVALLVEYAIVGQDLFTVARADGATAEPHRGIEPLAGRVPVTAAQHQIAAQAGVPDQGFGRGHPIPKTGA